MEKEQKQVIKTLHKFFSINFTTASEAYLNGFLSSEDILLYIENEVSVAQRIANIRKSLEEKQLALNLKAKENGNPVESCLNEIEEKLLLWELKKKQILNSDAGNFDNLDKKTVELKDLDEKIKQWTKILEDLELIKQEIKPKRKVGRPRKIKN